MMKSEKMRDIHKDFRIKYRTIDKQNEINDHIAYKQLILKSQRMSQIKNGNYINQIISNSRKHKSISKFKQQRVSSNQKTLKPLIVNHTPIPSILSNLNHKLIQQPNIHIWNRLAKMYQSQNQKDEVWETLYRNLDAKISEEKCCIKITRKKNRMQYHYYIILIRFNQKIYTSFQQKQWKKIVKAYKTYQKIEESIHISPENKIIVPINFDSQTISQHLKKQESTQHLHDINFQ